MDELTTEASAEAATDTSDDAKAAKLKAAADAAKLRRLKKKLHAAKSDAELKKLLRQQNGEASPEDQRATEPAPTSEDGWPDETALAGAMPGATMLVTQVLSPLKLTRYGECIEPKTVEVPDKSGALSKVTYDPIAVQLAPPVAALLAGSGGRLRPWPSLFIGLGLVFGPMAMAHGVEATLGYFERKAKRQEERDARRNGAAATAPQLPATAVQPAAAVEPKKATA